MPVKKRYMPQRLRSDGSARTAEGLARALTGNSQGAIEDFEDFIQKTGDENRKKQHQAWVKALRAGQNPFTKAELATLQNQ